jgi:hypothetical protein
MSQYSGANWIKSSLKVEEMSPLGEAVADLLGSVFKGIYHLDMKALRRVEWANRHHIIFILSWHSLSTWDFNDLTRLVVLCHDKLLRLEIDAVAPHRMELMFHQRCVFNGENGMVGHPTIEQNIEIIRKDQ